MSSTERDEAAGALRESVSPRPRVEHDLAFLRALPFQRGIAGTVVVHVPKLARDWLCDLAERALAADAVGVSPPRPDAIDVASFDRMWGEGGWVVHYGCPTNDTDQPYMVHSVKFHETPRRGSKPPSTPTRGGRMSDPRIAAAQKAAQQWWDDFCSDTGCHPDFVTSGFVVVRGNERKPYTSANFHLADGGAFIAHIVAAADAVEAGIASQLAEALRDLADAGDYTGDDGGRWDDAQAHARRVLAAFDATPEPNETLQYQRAKAEYDRAASVPLVTPQEKP